MTKQERLVNSINTLADKTRHRYPEILRRMNDPEYNRQKTQEERDRIAREIREARNRLKAKAK